MGHVIAMWGSTFFLAIAFHTCFKGRLLNSSLLFDKMGLFSDRRKDLVVILCAQEVRLLKVFRW